MHSLTLLEVFEKQVKDSPQRTAIKFGPSTFSYLELNERANQLAHFLIKEGIEPQSFIAIQLNRSPELIISILAAFKLGSAYIPLDPLYPQKRLDFIIEDVNPSYIICEKTFTDSSLTKMPNHNLGIEYLPSTIANIMYTSGSTGNPKGVVVTHHNIYQLFIQTKRLFHFSEKDKWVLFHSFGFDVSVWEIWGAFFYGGQLTLISETTARSIEEFYEIIAKEHITVLCQTPSTFKHFIQYEYELQDKLSLNLRYIILAGESLNPTLLKAWFETHGNSTVIVNMYGITETTIHSTFHIVKDSTDARSIIGLPIPGTQIHLLNENLQPVPPGVPGEIYLSGEGIALGYWNRAELTQERFLSQPLRLYKSGDIAIYHATEHVYEYLYRLDDQVKIRGYRIEINEIEHHILQHEGVKDVKIIVRYTSMQEPQLIAYLIPLSTASHQFINALRQSISLYLPIYMIPSQFIFIKEFPLTPNGKVDKKKLLSLLNENNIQAPDTIHKLFEVQTQKTPRALAIFWKEESLTFEEVNFKANQVAHYLLSITAGRNVPIGLSMERTARALILILGIFKAGCTYVPVHPKRIEAISNEIESPLIFTDSSSTQLWPIIESLPIENPDIKIDSREVAYIIYTSGSTGAPKGVMGNHEGLLNRFEWMWQQWPFNNQEKCCQKTSLYFVDSFWEIFGPLLKGVPLVIIPQSTMQNLEQFIDFLAFHAITRIVIVPSLLKAMLDCENINQLQHLHIWTSSGETLSIDVVKRFQSTFPNSILLNIYGSSEVAADVTYFEAHHCSDETKIVPIGRPITNTKIHILDAKHQAVKESEIGEIHVEGIGVALGYYKQPEMTKQSFVHIEGRRLYRTGDFGRWLPDGNIEYLGRQDRQVKVRGMRVELAEVENALFKHHSIKDCIVLPIHQDSFKAFVVLKHDVEKRALYSYLQHLIPDYMLPTDIVFLEEIPLNPNGKTDCLALKNLPAKKTEAQVFQSVIEKIITNIWIKLLEIPSLNREDNFFHLGGHSLLATQLISRLKRLLRKDIPIRLIFDHPILADFAAHIEQLPTLIKSGLTKRPQESLIPLSFSQQRLWFFENYIAQHNVHNVFRAYSIKGKIDISSLAAALNTIINRHEILRTSFILKNNVMVQHVFSEVKFALEVQQELDWTAFTQESFDLTKAPLIRVKMIKVSSQDHLLLLSMHHLITDGWSLNIFLKELNTLYNLRQSLGQLPLQYADFTVWQKNHVLKLEDQLIYWKNQLKDIPKHSYLPYDFSPQASQSYLGGNYSFKLLKTDVLKLKEIGERSQATLFMILLAAFHTLLHRYSGYEDIVTGSTIANRNWEDLEEIMGPIANTIVLRSNCQSSASFQSFLEQIRDITLQAYYHQDYPFDKLVEALPKCRSLDHHPFFSVMIVNNVIAHPLALAGLTCKELKVERAYSPFDLTLLINEMPEEVEINIEFAAAKFKQSTIERIAKHFSILLQSIIQDPGQIISQLSLLSSEEKNQIQSFANGDATIAKDCTIVSLFAEQAKQSPHAIALSFENQQMSYQELDHASEKVAKHLIAIGTIPDSIVAISLERSMTLVVYLLGILKSGAAYLYLDPLWPQERKNLILADMQPKVTITEPFNHFMYDDRMPLLLKPSHLAYIIYTSGSSGKPKGVMIEHQAICDRLLWCKQNFHTPLGTKILHMYAFSFDASVLWLWWPLIAGASIILATAYGLRDPDYLKSILIDKQINIASGTPSQLELIFNGIDPFPNLQMIISGGEVLNKKLLQYLLKQAPQVINFYGPTEAAVITTYWQAQLDESKDIIGRPVGNTEIFILDENQQAVPIGVKGEIYIAGIGLARGYWNNPAMNSKHFLGHPKRMYKTGDMGRFLENGDIEFLGRFDRQIKWQGYRIELNEIENCLRSHPDVKDAQVTFFKRSIDAYITLEHLQCTVSNIRQYLNERLPAYMTPHTIKIANFNLNEHGKRCSQSLEMINLPQTSLEKQLAIIWKKLLHLPYIDISQNIFNLGATSLLCVKASLLAKQLGLTIHVRQFFEHPTISSLALALSNRHDFSLVPIQENGTQAPLFLVHPGLGLIFPYKVLSKYFTNLPIYAIENPRFANIYTPYQSLKQMAKDYVELILKKQSKGLYRLGGWSFGGNVALEVAQQLKQLNHTVEHVLMIDSFNLSENTQYEVEHSNTLWELFEEEILNNTSLAKSHKPLPYMGKITLIQSEESKSFIANGWNLSIFPNMQIVHVQGNHARLFEEPFVEGLVQAIKFLE